MSIQIGKRLRYDHFFEEQPLPFNDYFTGINKEDIFIAISFLVNVSKPSHPNHLAKDLVSIWFSNENKALKNKILKKIPNGSTIANITSSLQLIEFVMQTEFEEERKISDAQLEVNLFKAYLLLNSEQDKIEERRHNDLVEKEEGNEKILSLMLTMGFHDSDLMNYHLPDLMIVQLIKSIEFFMYLSNRKELEPHLALFLKKYNSDSWEGWIKKYLSIILPIVQKKEKSYFDYKITPDKNAVTNSLFFDSFLINDKSNYTLSDFITLRSNPIFKIKEGHYRILCKLFLVEKLFKSIQFQFSLEINKEVNKKSRIKDFRADHCDNFSERTLLYNALRNSFPKKKWIHLSGDDFLAKGYSAEPDYYIRFKNKIFLFESKDVILKGEEKQSRDYSILKKALCQKFYKIEKGTKVEAKAVLQIIENIKRIFIKFYDKCDKKYNSDNIKIYPILVIHDRQFDSPAVNQLISKWFNIEKLKLKTHFNISNIQELTVLNIDTLLLHQEVFKQRGDNRIEKLISDYHENIKFNPKLCKSLDEIKRMKLNSQRPFSNFVDKELDKRKSRKMPPYVMKYIQKLFDDNEK